MVKPVYPPTTLLRGYKNQLNCPLKRGNLFIAGEVTFKGGEQLYLEQYFIVFIDLWKICYIHLHFT